MTTTTFPTATLLAAALFAASLVTGCAGQQQSVTSWREAADAYVVNQANGDLAALADEQQPSGHRVFTVIGEPDPQEGADAVGVFVAQRQLNDQPWMIFLVGEVAQRELQNSQLVAVTQRDGRLLWAMGEQNPQATQTYLRHQLIRNEGGTPHTGFPESGDRFRISTDGSAVTVTEQRSGATWWLNLTENQSESPTPTAAANNNPSPATW